jgi:hypothetical protein
MRRPHNSSAMLPARSSSVTGSPDPDICHGSPSRVGRAAGLVSPRWDRTSSFVLTRS